MNTSESNDDGYGHEAAKPEYPNARLLWSVVSCLGEFHPEALADPFVNVSIHTAPTIQPGKGHQDANARMKFSTSESLPPAISLGKSGLPLW